MIRVEGGMFLLVLALDVFCVIDVIQSREDEVRNLPKIAWLVLILLFPPIGSIAWLAAGRPQSGPARYSAYERAVPAYPEYDRPGRAAYVLARMYHDGMGVAKDLDTSGKYCSRAVGL